MVEAARAVLGASVDRDHSRLRAASGGYKIPVVDTRY